MPVKRRKGPGRRGTKKPNAARYGVAVSESAIQAVRRAQKRLTAKADGKKVSLSKTIETACKAVK